MLINSTVNFRIDKGRRKEEILSKKDKTLVPPASKFYSEYNYRDIERPLKTNQNDLSFKGLFSAYKKLNNVYSLDEFLKFSDKYIGPMGKELLDDITQKHSKETSKLISIEGDNIIIHKKTIPHLAWDGMIYPIKILPGDILNGIVEMMGKVPIFENWSKNILSKPMFKSIRQRSKIDAKVNSLTGLITFKDVKLYEAKEKFAKKHNKAISEITEKELEQIKNDLNQSLESKVFQSSLKMFDPKSGNYDTKHERSLNRLVSGLPPAVFLANDAYNLSRMMDDDDKIAKKEKKTRLKQEVSRILTSGYLTLITMGAFQKFINKSKFGIVLTTGITVLVTEMFSRLSNGKHITRLTPEEARLENEKLNTPEAKIKPKTNSQISSTGAQQNTTVSQNPSNKEKQQKPLLSFDTLMKASAVILGIGYSVKGFKNLSVIKNSAYKYFKNMEKNDPKKFSDLKIKDLKLENAVSFFESKVIFKPFKDLYAKMTSDVYHVGVDKFDAVVKTLKENGFEKLAEEYDKVGKRAIKVAPDGSKYIDLGSKDKKIKPLVNFFIAPFKFAWNTVTLPYWMVDEKLMSVFRKAEDKVPKTDIEALAESFEKICKQATRKNFNKDKFKDYVQVNLLKAFNIDSLSSVSNAELSNLAKTAASVATIWFLMTDNYNMVMLKSNGNDKEGANTKFKERFVQEGSRLFYQTLLIDLFNSTFRNQYHASLLGMSWITLLDTTLGEMLTRSSVGTALKPHTRDELIAMETKRDNATGFKKKYFTFMQRLTGKRSIKSYEVAPSKDINNPSKQIVSKTSYDFNKELLAKQSKVFEEFIR